MEWFLRLGAYLLVSSDTFVLPESRNAEVVLTRESLSGLKVTEKGGVAVKVDLISPATTASETVFNTCIL